MRLDAQESIRGLHWMFSTDLLFVVRRSFSERFAYEGINPAFESHLGLASEDVRDMDVSDCLNGDDARSVCEAFRACLAERREIKIRQRLALGGTLRAMETIVMPVEDPEIGSVVRLIGSHRPMCDGPFEDVAEGCGDRPDLNVGLVTIQEGIQQRIASDLHDSTCQHLIAASLGLMRIRSNLGQSVWAERLCDEIDGSIDEALREIRAFAYLLHPRNLAGEGLKATIEQYAEGFAARTSLRVTVDIVPDVDRLPYATKRTLLRVVQEALTNVFRHAKATEVTIVIETADGHFHLRVSDNGRGLPIDLGRRGNKAVSIGVGIPAMRARLRGIGGTLDIRSNRTVPHSGTVLCAVFPHGLDASRGNRRRSATTIAARAGAHLTKKR
ncbi:PAS domain-containing protein [Bradyrhizobium liaoningense]|uniref:sensor histidine kinase n=1 Tax=Bradyrhizobium liaoningense TaxID=43992 RepID=UPI001BA85A51|nr:ATP-binding protein [Bradyrhizobium liaoningense]MBR0841092.1 PAS domain-containing protein [Bradyrhizobium liaoningense]